MLFGQRALTETAEDAVAVTLLPNRGVLSTPCTPKKGPLMSLRLPRPSELPPTETASADSAKISRKGRKGVGIMLIIVAALNALQVVVAFAAYGKYLVLVTEAERNEALAGVALGVVIILAVLGLGIWNVSTKATTRKAPLIVALVAASLMLVFDADSIVDTVMTTGRPQGLIVVAFEVFVIVQAVRVLRLKPSDVTASAALLGTPPSETQGGPTTSSNHL